MDETHRPRVFVDLDAYEFLESLKKKEKLQIAEFLKILKGAPNTEPDRQVQDETGRTIGIGLFSVCPFILRAWRDNADNHLKLLSISREFL